MNKIWYGSESSYDVVMEAKVKLDALLKSNPGIDNQYEMPSLYTLQGDVGVVSIKGSLVEGSSGLMQMFGVTGYDDVSQALIEAVSDKKAKSIMLDVKSPGGDAKGVRAVGDLIKNIGEVKATSVFADHMGSAAYWLGSAGGHITIDEMGMAGSIGALTVHTEYSGAMEKEGIKKTIIRAGVNKSLANPIEPLSEEAKSSLQSLVDGSRDLFVNAVADNRGTTPSNVEMNMGQGREFMGMKAVQAGLADSVGNYEDALAYSKAYQRSFKATKSVKV